MEKLCTFSLLFNLVVSLMIFRTDWLSRTIPNKLVLILLVNNSFIAYQQGHLIQSVSYSFLLSLFLMVLWYYRVFGGGDVKLVLSFSVGLSPNLIFYNLAFIGILGGVLVGMMYIFIKDPFKNGVPYGIPICVSSIFLLLSSYA
ncbi:prepilin peptidase [Vibrio parahaemolyticus]|uniref:prepilin peptidase n=1 Tax=Vibrio parahaemolyticus TaxID=670 RepID=UPI003891E453